MPAGRRESAEQRGGPGLLVEVHRLRIELGGEAGARDAGKLRLEGKDYVVADGDVMHFRFNT